MTWVSFNARERACLKHNTPGPSGDMGGYQDAENQLLDKIPVGGGRVWLDQVFKKRLVRYCVKYGPGGPNGRLRKCCTGAFMRAGIPLMVEPEEELDFHADR